jgi:hypothetical protein
MKIIVEVEIEVNLVGDRVNADEVMVAVDRAGLEFKGKLATQIVEAYQQEVVRVLCQASGRKAKRGWGGHARKGEAGRCRGRRFLRAGSWAELRRLRGPDTTVAFRPALVACQECGKKFTPVLEALELESWQRGGFGLQRLALEAVADTSYRRGVHQLQVLGEIPVPRSTLHRWAVSQKWPATASRGPEWLLADSTGFQRQPGERGDVRIVLETGKNGDLRVLGVWAGTPWPQIGRAVKQRLRGHQPELFVGDGEIGMDHWVGRLAKRQQRSHWHFVRDARLPLWRDGVQGRRTKAVMKRLVTLLAIEIPGEDLEAVAEPAQEELRQRCEAAEQDLVRLQTDFEARGYRRAARYLARAREHLFSHLRLWLATGIVAPRTASLVESVIKELGRRLKRVGWNWSDRGAAKMGWMVLIRRYHPQEWEAYWRQRMNLHDRCQIAFTRFATRSAA